MEEDWKERALQAERDCRILLAKSRYERSAKSCDFFDLRNAADALIGELDPSYGRPLPVLPLPPPVDWHEAAMQWKAIATTFAMGALLARRGDAETGEGWVNDGLLKYAANLGRSEPPAATDHEGVAWAAINVARVALSLLREAGRLADGIRGVERLWYKRIVSFAHGQESHWLDGAGAVDSLTVTLAKVEASLRELRDPQ